MQCVTQTSMEQDQILTELMKYDVLLLLLFELSWSAFDDDDDDHVDMLH